MNRIRLPFRLLLLRVLVLVVLLSLTLTGLAQRLPLPGAGTLPTESGASQAVLVESRSRALGPNQYEFSFEWWCPDEFSNCTPATISHDILEVLPAGATVTFNSVTPADGTCTITTPTHIDCDLAPFEPQEETNIVFVVDHSADAQVFLYNGSNVAVEISRRVEVIDPVDYGTDLLVDGGFESKPLVEDWNLNTKAKRKCNKDTDNDGTPDKIVSRSGDCALMLKGEGRVRQTLSGFSAASWDKLWIGLYAETRNTLQPLKIKAVIKFADGEKRKVTVNYSAGTTEYSLGTGQQGLRGPVTETKIIAILIGLFGKAYIDDMRAVYVPKTVFD